MAGRKLIRWKYFVAATFSLVALILGASVSFLSPTAYAAPLYEWTSANKIKAVDVPDTTPDDMIFTCVKQAEAGLYSCTSDQPGLCKTKLTITGNALEGKLQRLIDTADGGCTNGTSETVAIIAPDGVAPADLDGSTGSSAGGAADAEDPNLKCNVTENPLTWFLCPFIKGMNAMINGLDGAINSMLTIDQKKIFETNCAVNPDCKSAIAYHSAWETFRGFAVALLIIAGLFMVIGQALGFETLDPYTMKKIVPRLVVAIIGIALSWEIMRFFVIATNDIGLGIRSIIYYPFRGFPGFLELGVGGQFILNIIGGAAITGFTLIGLLSFVATAALAIIVAFLVLIVRQLLIVVLILFAPIAIACYILPNTQSVWKLWYESFTKAMMMFPIIVAFLAIGRVFAVTSIGGNIADASAVAQLIGFAAYILPYFLIPLTFRFAGGALRTIGGGVNDRGRGGFDRLKKFRAGKLAESGAKLQAGERFNNRYANAMTARATTKRLGFGRQGREAYDNKMQLAAGAFGKSERGAAVQFKDPVLQAMSYNSAAEAENRLGQDFGMNQDQIKSAVAGVKASGGFGKARSVWAAKQLAATGTGYDTEAQMYSTIARVSGGNKEVADSMWGEMRGVSEKAGRSDLKASYGMGSELLSEMIDRGDHRASTADNERTYQDRFAALGLDAARGVDGMSLARNKPKAIQNMMKRMDQSRDYHQRIVNTTDGSVSEVAQQQSQIALGQIRAKMENMRDNISFGPEVNAEAVHGTRKAVLDEDTGLLSLQRLPGYQNVHQQAEDAARSPQARVESSPAYQQERMSRQGYDPRTDPRNNDGHE